MWYNFFEPTKHSCIEVLDDLREKMETERVNRESVELMERVLSITRDHSLVELIQARQHDRSLSQLIGTLSKLPAVKISIELTMDNSLYFTVQKARKSAYVEFFLEKEDSEPDFVLLVFEDKTCVNTGRGDIGVISNKLVRAFNI